MKRRIISVSLAVCMAATILAVPGMKVRADEIVIELNSGADKPDSYVTTDGEINADGQNVRLIMNGLNDTNKDLFIQAVEGNYRVDSEDSIKIIDDSLPDAEKWNEAAPFWEPYDSMLCWAASSANVLWISGWGKYLTNPSTGDYFKSEDEIFHYYSSKFSDTGGESDKGIDWIFNGEYFFNDDTPHSVLLDPDNPEDGLAKDIVISRIHDKYYLTKNPEDISQLENMSPDSETPSVFQMDIGYRYSDGFYVQTHAVTVAGVIMDPSAEDIADRYKAIAIVDSDNDGRPSEAASQIPEPTPEEKYADKVARPNSITFYPIKYNTEPSGKHYWELVDYLPDETVILYSLISFQIPNEALVNTLTESEGTCDAFSNPDFTLDEVFTTDKDKDFRNFYSYDAGEDECSTFQNDQPIRLVYYIANRGNVKADETSLGGKNLEASWIVKNSEGVVVAEGTDIFELPIDALSELGQTLNLNESNGSIVTWEPGEYTVTVNVNPSHNVMEAYFINNMEREFSFTVTEAPPDDPEEPSTEEEPTSEEEPSTEVPSTETPTTEVPTTEAPAPAPNKSNTNAAKGSIVKTGDADMMWVIGLMILSSAGIVYVARRKYRD